MSDLIVIGFDDENTADEAMNKLSSLQKEQEALRGAQAA